MNALKYIRSTSIGSLEPELGAPAMAAAPGVTNTIDIGKLPGGLVIGNTLLDVSNVPNGEVRAGISLSMLFANRVATHQAGKADVDSWLAAYQTALGELGFRLSGTATTNSTFKKLGVEVHKAIIPVLKIAFGGAAVGPVILSALEELGKANSESPWITLFDHESKRFEIKEMHFAATVTTGFETEIRYAVARLHVDVGQTQILFFKVTKNSANFDSLTTRLAVSNSLMAVVEDDLKERLANLIKTYIWSAQIS